MSNRSRRDELENVPFYPQFNPHAGLWFDKYLKEQKSDQKKMEPFIKHIQQTGEIKEPSVYEAFFNRWRGELEKASAVLREAQVFGRLAAGLGGETVIETGMTLHYTYGIPYIPGSSLKGSARAYAIANLAGVWAENGSAFRTLFGGQKIATGEKPEEMARAGIAVFHDALPVPGTWKIHNEVMTVHHSLYYRGEDSPPADWDSPTPIPFLSASGRFLIALHAPSAPEWASAGMDILKMALAESGVGGKTSSGYGRLEIAEKATESPEAGSSSQFQQELAELPNNRVAQEIGGFVNRWRAAELAVPYKQQMAQAILDKVEAAGRTKKSSEKAWYQELVRYVADDTK